MYFSQIRVDPTNDKTIYAAGLPWAKSLDGGRTFATLDNAGGNNSPGHVDQHALWIDPKNPKHLIIGNDGGLNISWDQGRTWDFVNTMATALPYWVSADMRRPYYVYIGLQDNGSWGGPSATRQPADGILNSDWFGIGGGDGFQTAVDPTDHNIVYTESQDGNTSRYDLRTGRQQSIRPRGIAVGGRGGGGGGGGRGGAPQPPTVLNAGKTDLYRFNWNTPFQLSPHNPSIIWLGGNRLFKSYNRGDTWIASADLTKQIDRNKMTLMGVPYDRTMLSKNDGVVSYSTIISLNESPVMPGVVWVGTDDGNVQLSRDGGVTFTEVGKNIKGLPADHLYLDLTNRSVEFRPRRRLRRRRRTPRRRPEAVSIRDPRLRKHVDEHRRESSGVGQHPGRQRGSQEQGPALRRDRVRALCVNRRRQELEEVHEQSAHCPRRRHPRPPARQRSDRCDARPQCVDCRRHHSPPADDGGSARAGRRTLRHPSCRRMGNRSPGGAAGRRAEGVHRREPAARRSNQLLPQEWRRRSEDRDRRRQWPHHPESDRAPPRQGSIV